MTATTGAIAKYIGVDGISEPISNTIFMIISTYKKLHIKNKFFSVLPNGLVGIPW